VSFLGCPVAEPAVVVVGDAVDADHNTPPVDMSATEAWASYGLHTKSVHWGSRNRIPRGLRSPNC
jgi:hypothetical protein